MHETLPYFFPYLRTLYYILLSCEINQKKMYYNLDCMF